MDAAERLGGQYGLDNVSVRMIATEAGVNLSAIGFHYRTREALVRAMLVRRLAPLMERRREALASLTEGPAAPTAEQVLGAFFDPLFEMSAGGSPGERAFLRVLAQTLVTPSPELREVLDGELAAGAAAFLKALARALPGLTHEEISNRMDFAVGAVGHALADPTRRGTYALAEPAADVRRLAPQLMAFITAGLRAPPTL
ncbi:MAG TPA: TetR/AcrR family transcriptional regulator [Caulobacteraceae bacterium]|nr:TetR/AcrR family transcriptional regulator [Caulobacteraceae bacterium]